MKFHNKSFKIKLFNKIFLLYSIVTVLSLSALSFFIIANLTQTLRQKELNFNKQILDRISTNFSQKYYSSLSIIQQLYANNEASSDLTYYLKNDYDDYIMQRLDRLYNSQSNTLFRWQTYFETYFSRDQDINSIMLYSKKKNFFSVYGDRKIPGSFELDPNIQGFVDKLFENTNRYYPYILPDSNLSPDNQQVYSIISEIKDPETLENSGALVVNYNTEGIYRTYEKYLKDIKGYIIMLTDDGRVLFDSSGRYYKSQYPYFNMIKESELPQLLEEKSYVNLIRLPDSGVVIAGVIPVSHIISGIAPTVRTIYLISFVLIFLSLLLAYFIISTFSRRTKVIMQGMEALKEGDFTTRIPVGKSDDELSQIAVNFNHMCESLTDYIKKVYVSEIKQKNAELTALQAQINPHFLYNTLEVIRMKAVSTGASNVGNMIYILAALFRNTVRSETFIPISEELRQCELYLQLFRTRYEEKLTYVIDVKEEIFDYTIVKFTLQPIIENCIFHGIKQDSEDNTIILSGYRDAGDICFTISDNGAGISEVRLNYLKDVLNGKGNYPSKSIGLSNVHERLRIIFGEPYGLNIYSEVQKGTTVEIRIPAKKREDMNDYAQGIIGG
ncbi:two-component system sensor histidine kinase YesM [Anaerobacterium chartisolvens]|uniref:Two-component system sensor histidine kinase YesM n=1 Tax=Anaerobacterium chartisolvens TaxID=1297424 RepID=A0A369B8U9_9FIRM|nr:sensor histidine kinase [Anaerobacterium chartisolvens]RCX17841.1 two-component system sensor histidine kinase YesM [Anaerobacterium chartisolvens]